MYILYISDWILQSFTGWEQHMLWAQFCAVKSLTERVPLPCQFQPKQIRTSTISSIFNKEMSLPEDLIWETSVTLTNEVSYMKHLAGVHVWSVSYPVLTCFSMKLRHSSSLARVATKGSLVTKRVAEFSLLPTWSSSVKYESLLLMLSATLTSFVCMVQNNHKTTVNRGRCTSVMTYNNNQCQDEPLHMWTFTKCIQAHTSSSTSCSQAWCRAPVLWETNWCLLFISCKKSKALSNSVSMATHWSWYSWSWQL